MFQCHILSEHCVSTSSSTRFFKVIHLIICSHEHKVWDYHRICHTLISSRDYHSLIFWSLLVNLQCWTPVTVWNRWSFSVLIKNAKDTKKGSKRVFSLSFLDPSSSRLASGLPGPPNDFRVKEPTRLGEPVTSRISLSSPGRAASPPKWPFAYK